MKLKISRLSFVFLISTFVGMYSQSDTRDFALASYVADATGQLENFRTIVGKAIKSVINKFLKNNPAIQKDLDSKQLVIKVLPQKAAHYTHLYLGMMPSDKRNTINIVILNTLNSLRTELKKNLQVQIKNTAKIKFLNNFVVLELPVSPNWYQFTQVLAQALTSVGLEPAHFKTYQKAQWEPHISLDVLVVSSTPSSKTKIAGDQMKAEILNYLGKTDVKTGKTLKALIADKLSKLAKEWASQPENLADLNLNRLELTFKSKPQPVMSGHFEFDSKQNKWVQIFPKIKKPQQVVITPEEFYAFRRELSQLAN